MKQGCESGKIPFHGPLALLNTSGGFDQWEQTLPGPGWNVNVQKAPAGLENRPEQLVKYLARYVAGTAISDSRLVSLIDGIVTFTVKNRQTGVTETRRLGAETFIDRFIQHIVPVGFHRIRHCGFWTHRDLTKRLEHIRSLIAIAQAEATPASQAATPAPRPASEPTPPQREARKCVNCESTHVTITIYTRNRRDQFELACYEYGHCMDVESWDSS